MNKTLLFGFVMLTTIFIFGCTTSDTDSDSDSPLTGNVIVDSIKEDSCKEFIPNVVVASPDSYSGDNVIIVTKTKLIGFDGYEPIRHPGTTWADGSDINVVTVPYCRKEGTTAILVCDALLKENLKIVLRIKQDTNWIGDRDKEVANFTVVDYECSSK